MKLTRGKRIVLELLGPPLMGAFLPIFSTLVMELIEISHRSGPNKWDRSMLSVVGYILLFAYALTGLQSVVYAMVLEWRFMRGFDPCSWRSVGLSSLLGLASGLPIAIGYGRDRSDLFAIWLFWPGLGLLVGFLMGLLIKAWSAEGKLTARKIP